MLKIIGIAFVSVSVSLYGVLLSLRIGTHARIRREIIELIYAIRSGIQYGNLSIKEIIDTFSFKELKKVGFKDILTQNEETNLLRAFSSVPLDFSEKEAELIFSFARECGKSTFCEEEIKNCNRYITLLESLDKALSPDEKIKQQIYGKLGILAGILCSILLL